MYATALQMANLIPDARQLLSDEPEMERTQHYQQRALLRERVIALRGDCP